MRISVNYQDLVTSVDIVKLALKGIKANDVNKTVLISVPDEGDRAYVQAYTSVASCRTLIDIENFSEEGEVSSGNIQLKDADLEGILSSFSNMSQTHATSVEFETLENARVKITVHEEANDPEENGDLTNVSDFFKPNLTVHLNQEKELLKEFPTDVEEVDSESILFNLALLKPLMGKDQATAFISFGKKWNFVSGTTTGIVPSNLPDNLRDFSLTESNVGLVERLCLENPTVEVSKEDGSLCIRSGEYESFLRFMLPKEEQVSRLMENLSKNKGVVVNRRYLKDTIRRVQASDSSNTKMILTVNPENIEVSTESFKQTVPVKSIRGIEEPHPFAVPINFFLSTILGDDASFDDNLFMYFLEVGRSWIVYVTDSSGKWVSTFSTSQVKKRTRRAPSLDSDSEF